MPTIQEVGCFFVIAGMFARAVLRREVIRELRQLQLQGVDFAAADVAHDQEGAVRGDAVPGRARVGHIDARDAFQRRDTLFFARGNGDAVDLRTIGPNIFEVDILAVGRPIGIVQNGSCCQVGPLSRAHFEQLLFLCVRSKKLNVAAIGRPPRSNRLLAAGDRSEFLRLEVILDG